MAAAKPRKKPAKKTATTRLKRGRLKIGDEWNAIVIIANSQTSPLKAVSELVENAIDAGAKNIRILRARKAGRMYLKVLDDGDGIRLNEDGAPDFRYVATHICDSMKRKLVEAERGHVHGEFGIGLLGFWSIGEELRLVSRGEKGALYEMVMRKGLRTFEQRRVRGKLAFPGAEVTILGLNDTTRNLLTGEKLGRYLASDLRDRIRDLKLNVSIEDRISRRKLRVEPKEFSGEPIHALQAEPSEGYDPLRVELYLVFRSDPDGAAVSVFRDGTRVLDNLCALDGFDRPPWNTGRVEGVVDFKALNLAPGTRSGIVPDEAFNAFRKAVEGLEKPLLEAIAEREREAEEDLSRGIMKSIWKAVTHALEDLPADYLLFDTGRSRKAGPGTGISEEPPGSREAGAPAGVTEEEEPAPLEAPSLFDHEAGPMAALALKPPELIMPPGGTRRVRAVVLDEKGRRIRTGVDYTFRIDGGCARIASAEVDAAVIKAADEQGEGRLLCTALERGAVLRAEARIVVSEDAQLAPSGRDGRRKGLPSFRYLNRPEERWRSRFDVEKNVILINNGHRDFAAARVKAASLRRYLAKLYAKEMVHLNFPDAGAPEAMERLIELIMRMEPKL